MNLFRIAILGLCVCAVLSACGVAPPPPGGWAIVAVDPQRGDVAVAGASCSEYPYDYRAALVPKLGAGVQLGVGNPLHRDRFRAWMEQPLDAQTIVNNISAVSNDPESAKRQYGVITMQKGAVQHAAFTGRELARYTNELFNPKESVLVLGSGLVNDKVLRAARDAFLAEQNGVLPDKLMRALEAGSAEGGLALCNRTGVAQTASSAFIMFARSDGKKFEVKTLGNAAPQEPDPPYLALSATEPIGGRNAILLLREQYNVWRPTHLGECAECLQLRVRLPIGGTLTTTPEMLLANNALPVVIAFIILVTVLTIVYSTLRPRTGRSFHPSSDG